ncbi:thaumatin family protein [Fodinicola feengrottensis]|uniref:thaumatin family protein n=1 Tax=Fodinicola feengrottensis TaxID=435914 RepID=UPI0024417D07|nr:thaumatin family protein [Fodinicola feengrottensis]
MTRRWTVAALLAVAMAVTGAGFSAAAAAINHTVTFVNQTGQTVWIGSTVNADRSVNFAGLPTLANGQSATITIPETTDPGHWRGKFFARQGCSGNSGSSFHCQVADCGPYADRCSLGEQPASLAEFNFDSSDGLAPWYDVSYVNAFSVPITIEPVNATTSCGTAGCPENLLPYCPSAYLQHWPDGRPMNASIRTGTRKRTTATRSNRTARRRTRGRNKTRSLATRSFISATRATASESPSIRSDGQPSFSPKGW